MSKGSYVPKTLKNSDSSESHSPFTYEQLALFPLPEELTAPQEESDEDGNISDHAGTGKFIDILEEV